VGEQGARRACGRFDPGQRGRLVAVRDQQVGVAGPAEKQAGARAPDRLGARRVDRDADAMPPGGRQQGARPRARPRIEQRVAGKVQVRRAGRQRDRLEAGVGARVREHRALTTGGDEHDAGARRATTVDRQAGVDALGLQRGGRLAPRCVVADAPDECHLRAGPGEPDGDVRACAAAAQRDPRRRVRAVRDRA
jgi:hypothetical protein